jgi:hypothetical protein
VTRFLVLIYGNEHQWATANEEWNAENGRRHRAFLDSAGDAVLIGGELVPSARAVSIRCDGESHQSVSAGAFVTAPAAIGGFYLLEAEGIEAAITLARGIPEASSPGCGVEVRAMPPVPN